MKHDDILRLFPRASQSVLALADDTRLPEHSKSKGSQAAQDDGVRSELERNPKSGRVGPGEAQEGNRRRFYVRVTSVRARLLDEDNLCEKYVVDLCRYAGMLPKDCPGEAEIKACQRKVKKGEEPHTLIEIFNLTPI
jgi:hypothetical protein